jgi:FkbM family methyltransferase
LKKTIKSIIKKLIGFVIFVMVKTSNGRELYQLILNIAMNQTQKVEHQGVSLIFSTSNDINKYRADTFSTKEPETLEWIDNIPQGSVFWDIGANVGLYTCYATKARGCRVFSFEPSVFNLEHLARNIYLNGIADLAVIIPLPLSDTLAINKLNMTTTEWGGALSTFGESYGYNGQPLSKVFEFSTISLPMKNAHELFGIPLPDFIKIDVDGIEHLILKGGAVVLENAQSVLIEICEEFHEQAEGATRYLTAAGLHLKEKRRSDEIKNISESTYNQIWHRELGH